MKNKVYMTMAVFIIAISLAQGISLMPAHAATSSAVEKAVISISGSKSNVSCKTYAKGIKGTKRIEITMTLQKNNNGTWKNEKTWSDTKKASTFTLTKSKSLSRGTYRIKSTIKAYMNSRSGAITRYSSVVNY